jgi:hypothetical protein
MILMAAILSRIYPPKFRAIQQFRPQNLDLCKDQESGAFCCSHLSIHGRAFSLLLTVPESENRNRNHIGFRNANGPERKHGEKDLDQDVTLSMNNQSSSTLDGMTVVSEHATRVGAETI